MIWRRKCYPPANSNHDWFPSLSRRNVYINVRHGERLKLEHCTLRQRGGHNERLQSGVVNIQLRQQLRRRKTTLSLNTLTHKPQTAREYPMWTGPPTGCTLRQIYTCGDILKTKETQPRNQFKLKERFCKSLQNIRRGAETTEREVFPSSPSCHGSVIKY